MLIPLLIVYFLTGCTNKLEERPVSNQDSFIIAYDHSMAKVNQNNLSKDSMLFYLENALESVHHIPDGSKSRRLAKIAYKYFLLQQESKFKEVNRLAIAEGKKIQDSLAIGDAYWSYASKYKHDNLYDSAYVYYRKAHKFFNSKSSEELAAKMLYNMSLIQGRYNNISISEQLLMRSIKIFEEHNDSKELYACFNHLAILQNDLEEYDLALKYHKKALSYLNEFEEGSTYYQTSKNNIGSTYLKKGDTKNAIEYFQNLLNTINIENPLTKKEVRIVDNWAYCRFMNQDTIGLWKIFKRNLRCQDSLKNIPGTVLSKIRLAKFSGYKGDTLTAVSYATSAREISKSADLTNNYLESLQLLSELDMGHKDQYLTEYIRFKDSLEIVNRRNKNKFARISYETNQYIKANEELSREKLFILISSVGGIIILILLFSVLLLRSQKSKLMLESEQQKASEQIYQLTYSKHELIAKERQEEQKRISEELHDGILGKLFGLRMSIGFKNLDQQISSNSIDEIVDELGVIENEIRQMSHRLNSGVNLDEISFEHLVREVVIHSSVIGKFKVRIEFDEFIDWDQINKIVFINLYRILQEAMHNIVKYAQASHVEVSLTAQSNNLKLVINDDGIGFNVSTSSEGIGIKNMKSRIKKLHGKINIISESQKGTVIICKIPLT